MDMEIWMNKKYVWKYDVDGPMMDLFLMIQ